MLIGLDGNPGQKECLQGKFKFESLNDIGFPILTNSLWMVGLVDLIPVMVG